MRGKGEYLISVWGQPKSASWPFWRTGVQTGIWVFTPPEAAVPGARSSALVSSPAYSSIKTDAAQTVINAHLTGVQKRWWHALGVDFPPHSPLWEVVFIRHLLHGRLHSEVDIHGLVSSLPRPSEEGVSSSPFHRQDN